MATNFLWGTVGSKIALLTTELNTLAAATLTALSSEIDNSGTKYQWGMLTFTVASVNVTSVTGLRVFFVPSSDTAGISYPTMTSYTTAGILNYDRGIIYVNQSNAAQLETLMDVRIPPGKFKVAAALIAGSTTLASSGNKLDLYPTPSQY